MTTKRSAQLLLASGNPAKRMELEALLAPLRLELLDLTQAAAELRVQETGADYVANAVIKARSYAQESGLWALADDSGLEVVALDGAPGLRSARLAGPDRSDEQRRQVLLRRLQGHARPWRARFRCALALAGPDGRVDIAEGECRGEVIPEERGHRGFGYDPIFLVEGTGRTMAELSLERKNRLSHRARALQALLPTLKERLQIEEN
jgi:XTP/dITP diphosphohydrolase